MNIDVRFASNNLNDYEETIREAARTGNAESIRRIQQTFQNLSPEEQSQLQTIIDEVYTSATDPAKSELQSLRETIRLYQEGDQISGVVNLSSGTPAVAEIEAPSVTLSDSEYLNLARDVIRDTSDSEIRGDRELYLFQKYYDQIHQIPGFSIDGVSGPQTLTAINYSSHATVIFLRELGVKAADGGTLNIRDSFTPEITEAIQRTFGVMIESQAESSIETREIPTITQETREALATEILGVPLTEAKIREYQTRQQIGIDGILGNETYGEMLAGKVKQEIATGAISAEKQSEILDLLSYANANGVNMVLLRALLITRNTELQALPNYDTVYKSFFEQVGVYNSRETETPEGQALAGRVDTELSTVDADGRSTYRRIADGVENGNLGEEMESLIAEKGPMMLFILAAGFVFGMIPGVNDSVATNSWWKRLLIAGVGLANGQSITDMIGDAASGISSAVRSPEAQSIFENGRTGFLNFFETTLPEFFANASDTLGTQFDSFVQNFENANEAKRNSPEFIENISEKGSVIISDEMFLNASKDQIIAAINSGSLAGILSQSGKDGKGGLDALTRLNMTPPEIQNYLKLYVLPRFTDDDTLVRDIFITTGALDTLQGIQLDLNKNFIANPDLNLIIQNEIQNLRLVGTEAQKNAATQLGIAIQATDAENFSGTFSNFKLDDHPALTANEKVAFENLLKKLEIIFSQEGYISQGITDIGEIQLSQGETEFTLTTRLESLESIHGSFSLNAQEIQAVGLVPERFSIPAFEDTYAAKRMEILRAFSLLTPPVTSVIIAGVTIDIATELQTVTERELQAQNLTDTQNILKSLGEVPSSDASINDIRTYYDTHAENFSALDTLNASTLDPEMRTLVDQGIAKKTELITNYTLARQRYVDEFNNLQSEVAAIQANSNYESARRILQEISAKYYTLASQVLKNVAAENIFQDLSYYFAGTIPEYNEENSLSYLDGILLVGTPVATLGMNQTQIDIQSKITEIESAYDTAVSLSGVVIGNISEIQKVITELTHKKEVVDIFVNSGIQELKYREIAEQFKSLQNLYISAIQNSSDNMSLERIMAEYRSVVQNYVINGDTSFWNDTWTMVEGVFTQQDEVERMYEEKKQGLEILGYLEKDINDPSLDSIENIYMNFLKTNDNIPKIHDFNVRLGTAVQQGQPVTLMDIYNTLLLWENDSQLPSEIQSEIHSIIERIENLSQ